MTKKSCPPHDWKENGKVGFNIPVRVCKKCKREEYFWGPVLGPKRWHRTPP